jgi:hypothetical protein
MGLRDQQNAELCQRLKAFAAAGLNMRQTAEKLDISYQSVVNGSKRFGIVFSRKHRPKVNPRPDGRADEFAVRFRNGETLQSIATSHGITRERVRQVLTRKKGMDRTDGGIFVRSAVRRKKIEDKREQDARARWGCSRDEYVSLLEVGRRMIAEGLSRDRTPAGAFANQKQNAKSRGIEWRLTLWQWWAIWQESGRWEDRGRGHNYMMCRKGDAGPYAVGNVFIAPGHFNSTSGPHKKSGLPTGVSLRKGRYVAQICVDGEQRYLGVFGTPAQAHEAYLTALAEASPAREVAA